MNQLVVSSLVVYLHVFSVVQSGAGTLEVDVIHQDILDTFGIDSGEEGVILSQQKLQKSSEPRRNAHSVNPSKVFNTLPKRGSSYRKNSSNLLMSIENMRARLMDDRQICRMVCNFCPLVTSKSVSALCQSHCSTGGRAFIACLTFWSIRHDLIEWKVRLNPSDLWDRFADDSNCIPSYYFVYVQLLLCNQILNTRKFKQTESILVWFFLSNYYTVISKGGSL